LFEIKKASKSFEETLILDDISITVEKGSIYGIVGVNGAGKSTLLRLMAGIYKSDNGEIHLEGENIYENKSTKEKLFFLPDEIYYFAGATINKLGKYYKNLYPNFSTELFEKLKISFALDPNKNINSFSKGQKKQASLIIAISSCTEYLILDETFDGLDPITRIKVKKILFNIVAERKLTVILSSHNLTDLESICDKICLLYKNKIVFEKNVSDEFDEFHKIQIAFKENFDFSKLNMKNTSFYQMGAVATMSVKGNIDEIFNYLNQFEPIILEVLPLSLDEIFINELEALGYEQDIFI
jgi:ABC-2 type transport system ATP-binding protein